MAGPASNAPSAQQVVISDSFDSERHLRGIASARQFAWGEDLPPRTRGIYVGTSGDVFLLDTDDQVIPYIAMSAGIWQPVCEFKQVLNEGNYATTARNIVVGTY